MINQLKQFLESISPIPQEEWNYVTQLYTIKTFTKGEFLNRVGDTHLNLAFVVEGVFEVSFINRSGKKMISKFIFENDIATPYEALLLNSPSTVNIEALERTTAIILDGKNYSHLIERHISWQKMARLLGERSFLERSKKEKVLGSQDATERYFNFHKIYPQAKGRITGARIAEYLGITPETYSRIKKRQSQSQVQI